MSLIVDVAPDQAFYRPGQEIRLWVDLTSDLDRPVPARLVATIHHLADEVARVEQALTVPPGSVRQTVTWTPPPRCPAGYGVDLHLLDNQGTLLGTASTAFDVLAHWTQAPRYGFLSDFSPDRTAIEETMAWLTRYHINGLQFYDWMYRHEDLLTPEDPYHDPLGRLLSRRTVDALIAAAHRHNIAAMPYTAIYGASVPFFEAHSDWALRQANGQPLPFGENFLYIMDPSPDSPWTEHLMGEFAEVLRETGFDGIHLDQYGDPKAGFDSQGRPVDLAQAIVAFINRTKATATALRPDATVVFNAVTNWPIKAVAPAAQDFAYIEVWPPYTRYHDLWDLVVNAQALGHGKPVVLAAYIPPARHRNVRLANAVIFASGGFHIELGEPSGMLAEPYFPAYQPMSDELATVMRRYYDFAVRYANVLSVGTRDTTNEMATRVTIEGITTDPGQRSEKVWLIARRGANFEALSLINLLGIHDPAWNSPLSADPTPVQALQVTYQTERPVARLWLASPDDASLQATSLDFESGQSLHENHITFTVPRLDYWDLVVIEFAR